MNSYLPIAIEHAGALLRAGRYRSALDTLITGLSRELECHPPSAHVSPEALLVAGQIADLAVYFRQFRASDEFLAGIEAAARVGRNRGAGYYATAKRAINALDAGDVDATCELLAGNTFYFGPVPEAVGILRGWTALVEQLDREVQDSFLALALLAFGRWRAAEGNYEASLVLLERAVALAENEHSVRLAARSALAAVRYESGCFAAAERELAALDRELGNDLQPGRRAEWLTLGAKLDLTRGRFGEVLPRLTRVAELCQEAGFQAAAAAARLNEAHVRMYFNQLAEAEEALSAAAPAIETGSAMDLRLRALRQLLEARGSSPAGAATPPVFALWADNATAPAAAEAAPLPADPRPGASFLDLFDDRLMMYHWELAAGDRSRASERLAQLRDIFGSTESDLIRTRLRAAEAVAAYDFGRLDEAEGLLKSAQADLERLGLLPELWQVVRARGWCADRRGTAENFDERLQEIAAGISGSLAPADAALWWANKWTVTERLLNASLEDLVRADEPAWWPRPWKRWMAVRRWRVFLKRIDEDRRQLALRESSGASAAAPRPPQVGWAFPRLRSAVLGFLVLPDRTLVSLTGAGGLRITVRPVGRVRLRSLVKDWYRGLDAGRNWPGRVAAELSEELGLPALLHGLPRHVRRLTIVPDDALHGFPFSALTWEGGGHLIDHFALTMAYDRSQYPLAARPCPRGAEALPFGVSRAAGGGSSLPGTTPEVREAAAWMRDRGLKAEPIIDTLSREEALRLLPFSAMVHAACHGEFQEERPDQTGLLLSPAEGVTECLSLGDFARLDLSYVRHITLSSCWGADNYAKPNRWVVSLPEVLCRQGAESVLSNLFPVYDEVGPIFAKTFYDLLKDLPRDDALRQTQLAFLQGKVQVPRGNAADPRYWAGYRLHGCPGRLRFTKHWY